MIVHSPLCLGSSMTKHRVSLIENSSWTSGSSSTGVPGGATSLGQARLHAVPGAGLRQGPGHLHASCLDRADAVRLFSQPFRPLALVFSENLLFSNLAARPTHIVFLLLCFHWQLASVTPRKEMREGESTHMPYSKK